MQLEPRKIWYAPNKMEAYGEPEIKAVEDALRDGWLAGNGPRSDRFEREVATLFGKRFGVFVNSGSSAILLALATLKLAPGSDVITPACTFSTTVAPIVQMGLKPRFCDVQPNGQFVPSVTQVLDLVSDQTRLILLPNLIGAKPDWAGLREGLMEIGRADIILLEDSADTITHTPQSDIATTSFYSSHVITACGSGGMVMFNDEVLERRARGIRDWGRVGNNLEDMVVRFGSAESIVDGIRYDVKFLYNELGYNFKSSEVCAAFGLVQLARLPQLLQHRRMIFNRYMENLVDVADITLPRDDPSWNWLAMPLMVGGGRRERLLEYLESNHVQTRVCFAGNITRHPAYRAFLEPHSAADRVMRDGFLLGAHHGMTVADVDRVCGLIKLYFTMV